MDLHEFVADHMGQQAAAAVDPPALLRLRTDPKGLLMDENTRDEASSFSDLAGKRTKLSAKAFELARANLETMRLETTAMALDGIWQTAAEISGIPLVTVFVKPSASVTESMDGDDNGDEDADEVCLPFVLESLRRQDLRALLVTIHEQIEAKNWRRVWTLCRDAFGLRGDGTHA